MEAVRYTAAQCYTWMYNRKGEIILFEYSAIVSDRSSDAQGNSALQSKVGTYESRAPLFQLI